MDSANCGYEESRTASPTTRRSGATRKTLRDTRIRTIHGMEELKRAQEMRVDEFSLQKQREVMLRLHCRVLLEDRQAWTLSFSPAMVDQQRLQISELHFDTFSTPSTFSCWKIIRFKTKVCSCSDFPSEAILWIEDVEKVDSVDDLKSSSSIRGLQFPNFEMLDSRTASPLNKIIQNSYFKKKVSLEEQKAQKEDRFLRGRQIAYIICDCFRVTGAHDAVLDYADWFSIALRNDDVQEILMRDGMKFHWLWPRSHLMISWKVCTNWEYVSLINSTP